MQTASYRRHGGTYLFFLLALPVCNPAQTADPMTNQRVIQLSKSGVHADELLRMISTAPAVSFRLTPADTDQLLRASVSEETIRMMSARENGSSSPTRQAPIATVNSPNARPRGIRQSQRHRDRDIAPQGRHRRMEREVIGVTPFREARRCVAYSC
jgi:hypothetical protein